MEGYIFILIAMFILFVAIAVFISWRGAGETITQVKTGGSSKLRLKDLKKHPRSRSEAEVIRYLELLTNKEFPTAYPQWLVWRGHNLELDGYNGDLALEFSGPQHTKWYPAREKYEEYFERIIRDIVKVKLCKKHRVNLIVVDASLPSRHWRAYIVSRLHDFGMITDKPAEYIPAQIAPVYRNTQIEEELGLMAEMRAVEKL